MRSCINLHKHVLFYQKKGFFVKKRDNDIEKNYNQIMKK